MGREEPQLEPQLEPPQGFSSPSATALNFLPTLITALPKLGPRALHVFVILTVLQPEFYTE